MDTIPEALYQDILSYLLGDVMNNIFRENYEVQFINKTFKRCFQHYLKTKPLMLYLSSEYHEFTLQCIKIVKRYDVHIHDLSVDFHRAHYNGHNHVIKTIHDINFSSLRKLWLFAVVFDLELFTDCKELKGFTLEEEYGLDDLTRVKALQTFLSSYKHNLEYLNLPASCVPKDLTTWPNLKTLRILDEQLSTSSIIDSSTLQHLVIEFFPPYNHIPGNKVIKCPNLKVLHIINIPHGVLDLDDRFKRSYDGDVYGDVYEFLYTCHPSELRKIGMEVKVGDDCDIGIEYDEENQAIIFPNYNE